MPVFLFSDIEGSTARWESSPAAMSEAVRRHDEILRSVIESHAGRVFKTVGDAFCVVFDSAAAALPAAVEAQRALIRSDWSPVGGLHVRMAIHSGDAIERDGDFFGQPVNRVARLLSAAHGGQIVVSGAIADSLNGAAPRDVVLRALGTFRLKDLEQPERIYQVFAPGIPERFKPLVTLDAIPNNLPLQSGTFVGRDDDLVILKAMLRETSMLTIAGPGGVGKTRVALQCAADRMDRMTGGVWFVNLAPLTDPSLVASTMLSAVGASASENGDALESLVDALKTRTALVILDNCEHVVDEAARCIAAVMQRCPHVTVLATSREALRVDGEQVYRLNPLGTDDALSLFVTRAKAVSSGFALTAENRGDVQAICAHLDGIPLAIELAAARTHAMSPRQLAERLNQRFKLLTGGGRTALPRQQTLQALIDWSHDLLGDSEKMLFRRLAVFRGSFTLDSASAVCADDALDEWTIVDLLTSLADKSLVVAEVQSAQPRYYLLESIREYASDKLREAGEAAQLQLCHARFFAQRAQAAYEQFDTRPPENWLSELAPDLDNFRAALEWSLATDGAPALGVGLAADIAPLFLRLSLLREGVDWCCKARACDETAPPAARARLRYVLSMLYNNQSAHASALPNAAEAVALYREAGDERGLIRALSQTAQQLASLQRFDEAQPYCDEALRLAEKFNDPRLFAATLRRCAFALPPSEIETARAQFQAAISALQSAGDRAEACLVLQWWAESEASAGNFERALAIGSQAMSCADSDDRMYLSGNMAGYAIAARDFASAEPLIREAVRLAVGARHELATAIALLYYAVVLLRHDARDAARLFGYARRRMRDLSWEGFHADRTAQEAILADLAAALNPRDLERLIEEGSAWSEEHALSRVDLAAS